MYRPLKSYRPQIRSPKKEQTPGQKTPPFPPPILQTPDPHNNVTDLQDESDNDGSGGGGGGHDKDRRILQRWSGTCKRQQQLEKKRAGFPRIPISLQVSVLQTAFFFLVFYKPAMKHCSTLGQFFVFFAWLVYPLHLWHVPPRLRTTDLVHPVPKPINVMHNTNK